MATITPEQVVFPTTVIVDCKEPLEELMSEYCPTGKYDRYDYTFMWRILYAIAPSFTCPAYFVEMFQRSSVYFSDATINYSDEAYDPNKLIKLAQRLSERILAELTRHKAYVNGQFPYVFVEVTPDLSLIFQHVHRITG